MQQANYVLQIYNCYNIGTIEGYWTGGMLGYRTEVGSTKIINCYNIGMYRKLLMVSQQKSLLHISNLFWLTSCNYNSSKLRKLSYTCYGDLIISLPRLEAIFLKFLYYF